jgi:hypothetical protein
MKINSILASIFVVIVIFLVSPSCKKNNVCGETNISESGGDDSHNFGQNCMNCHTSGGKGEGCFVVAGSVSNSALTSNLTSGTVKFYTEPNGGGTLKATVQIDSKGNFHTTESIDVIGLYPVITGSNGVPHSMGSSLSSGSCNSCHGVSTGKLYAN